MNNGKWMYSNLIFPQEGENRFPVLTFRKEIELKHFVQKAKISITAKGIYSLFINGKKVSDCYFAPGWCDYRKELFYQEYDVSEFLTRGKNVIAIELAAGWYYGTMGLLNAQAYGNRGAICYKMEVNFRNGEWKVYESDAYHKVGRTRILDADILDGEIWDGRISEDYKELGFDDSKWENSLVESCDIPLKKQDFESVRYHEYLYPQLISVNNGVYIYDFGRNFAGNIEATISAQRDTRLTFRYAEILDANGGIYTRNLRRAKSTDAYICGGKTEKFSPEYVYHGFRYVEVRVEGGELTALQLRAKSLTTDFNKTVEIVSSNQLLNDLIKAIDNTMKANFLAVPTDCPQRDERLGWLGDICAFGGSAMYLADCEKYIRKYLGDIRNAQFDDGCIYNVAPFIPEVAGSGDNGWGDAIVFLTYDHYSIYGDIEVVKENMSAMKKWVDYLVASSDNYLRLGEPGAPADWLALSFTEKKLVNTAYSFYSASMLSEMCLLLGDPETNKYKEITDNFKTAFCNEYLRGNELTVKTQGAYALAIAFGLVEPSVLKESFEQILNKDNYLISTGFLSTRYLLPALCEIGRNDLAYKLLLNSEYPSWGYMLLSGGTTIWERWNGITTFYGSKVLEDFSMNSFCHCALGAIIEWIIQYMFGLQIIPGATTVLVNPYFDPLGRIKDSQCTFHTKDGEIKVNYTYQKEAVRYDLQLPEKMKVDFQSNNILDIVKHSKGNKYTVYYSY